ncbi:MAG TPA: twin-arginine translocase TatA/TatE family subunit [Ignavibacteria bacterium]|nr:twin-arginine translocase TatA/TatE family subunit [Ignavibacteria bacterium]
MSLGWSEILIIILIIIVLFGGKKIPELMSGIGKGIKEFKKGVSGEENGKEKDKDKSESDSNPK